MSDEKSKVTDKASEIAKNIWLAGVGAYGKAVEDAQGRLEKAMEPPKLFKDLVKAALANGEALVSANGALVTVHVQSEIQWPSGRKYSMDDIELNARYLMIENEPLFQGPR